MSSFYWCNSCCKAVDVGLLTISESDAACYGFQVCKECSGTNWEVRNGQAKT
jgi:hypothetical protein